MQREAAEGVQREVEAGRLAAEPSEDQLAFAAALILRSRARKELWARWRESQRNVAPGPAVCDFSTVITQPPPIRR